METEIKDPDLLRMENVREFGKFSFDLEEKREQSILNQSSQMLTAFSLFSAAILMALPIVTEYSAIPDWQIMYLTEVAFAPLIVSLVLAIIAQWRFSYQTMLDAEGFENILYRQKEDYHDQSDYDWQWVYQLSAVQKSKKKNTDFRVRLIKASMICFLLSVAILVIGNLMFFIHWMQFKGLGAPQQAFCNANGVCIDRHIACRCRRCIYVCPACECYETSQRASQI